MLSGRVEAVEFLVWGKIIRHTICVPEICIALVVDADPAEKLRDVKSTGTELASSKLFSPEKCLLLFDVEFQAYRND